jgi:hypothetical protein
MKLETTKKDLTIKQIKIELDKKEKQLSAMTNLNRTLQSQIQVFKTKSSEEDSKENTLENNMKINESEIKEVN